MINRPTPFKSLNRRMPIIIPISGRVFSGVYIRDFFARLSFRV